MYAVACNFYLCASRDFKFHPLPFISHPRVYTHTFAHSCRQWCSSFSHLMMCTLSFPSFFSRMCLLRPFRFHLLVKAFLPLFLFFLYIYNLSTNVFLSNHFPSPPFVCLGTKLGERLGAGDSRGSSDAPQVARLDVGLI